MYIRIQRLTWMFSLTFFQVTVRFISRFDLSFETKSHAWEFTTPGDWQTHIIINKRNCEATPSIWCWLTTSNMRLPVRRIFKVEIGRCLDSCCRRHSKSDHSTLQKGKHFNALYLYWGYFLRHFNGLYLYWGYSLKHFNGLYLYWGYFLKHFNGLYLYWGYFFINTLRRLVSVLRLFFF